MKKKIKRAILVFSVIILVFLLYKNFFSARDNFRSVNMVPKNAFMIIESDDPFATWKDLNNSMIWGHMQSNTFFSDINTEIYSADSLLKENRLMFRLFGSRKILVSAHHLGNDKYGILVVADMKNLSKLKIIKTHLTSLNNDSYTVAKRNFGIYEIFEIYDKEYKEMIYLSFVENLLALSYDHLLLEKALKQSALPDLARDNNFIEISNQIEGSGQVRFLLNFNEINKLLKFDAQNGPSGLNSFLSLLFYGGWKIDIKDDFFDLEGYINGTDTIPNFINAMRGTGHGDHDMAAHISKRSFMYLHMGFSSLKKLINNLEENLKQENLFDEYAKNRRKIEKLLDIDIDKHIISWIGDEVGIVYSKSNYKNQPVEYILVLKAENEQNAHDNLSFLNKQVKKNTPVKFKTIHYKNTAINYLSATGLFKLFFGKFFTKLEKPYYMIYNHHVYFSNHPQTLKDIIDDIENGNTLQAWGEYNEFHDKNFSGKSNIYIFLNTPVLFDEMKNNELSAYKKEIAKNKSFIDQLPFIGIQLDGKKNLFYSHLGIQYRDTLVNEVMIQSLYLPEDKNPLANKVSNEIDRIETIMGTQTNGPGPSKSEKDPFELENIVILDLSKGNHQEYYEGHVLKLKVEIYGGMKHGNFVYFYENGNKKLTGKFKNDKKNGTWKYYDDEGNLLEKRKFE